MEDTRDVCRLTTYDSEDRVPSTTTLPSPILLQRRTFFEGCSQGTEGPDPGPEPVWERSVGQGKEVWCLVSDSKMYPPQLVHFEDREKISHVSGSETGRVSDRVPLWVFVDLLTYVLPCLQLRPSLHPPVSYLSPHVCVGGSLSHLLFPT